MKMRALSVLAVVTLVFAGALSAQHGTVAGKWALSADSPHGKLALELDLKQDASVVTGTFLNPGGARQPVKGEFSKGTLTLETTSGDEVAFSGTLKPDGTLAGHVSTAHGDLNWTATRAKS